MIGRLVGPRSLPWLIFGVIFCVAAVLRCWHLNRQSFWLDEVYSVESSMGRGFAHRLLPANTLIERAPDYFDARRAEGWWRIWPACTGPAGDLHPPLPYMVLRWWSGVFGQSDRAARGLSVVASLAGLGLLFLITRELHGDGVALWACAIMALAGPQIQYAQEAKHYALLQAFALGACLAMVRIEKRGGSA